MNKALWEGVYAALTADTALMAAVGGVYSKPPQPADSGASEPFPYVMIGDGLVSPWGTDDWSGGNAVCRIHVFSRHDGPSEAFNVIGLIRAALDRNEFSIAGYQNVTCNFEGSFADLDPDGETQHGVIEFRVLIC